MGELLFSLKASKIIYKPIKIKIPLPINLVKNSGKINWIIFPKIIEIYAVISDIINNINFPINEIFVFFIP